MEASASLVAMREDLRVMAGIPLTVSTSTSLVNEPETYGGGCERSCFGSSKTRMSPMDH